MNETALLWLLGVAVTLLLAIAGVLGWVVRWMLEHHKQCHSVPMQEIAMLKTDVAAMKIEDHRLATNIHKIRGDFSPMTAFAALAREIVLESTKQKKG